MGLYSPQDNTNYYWIHYCKWCNAERPYAVITTNNREEWERHTDSTFHETKNYRSVTWFNNYDDAWYFAHREKAKFGNYEPIQVSQQALSLRDMRIKIESPSEVYIHPPSVEDVAQGDRKESRDYVLRKAIRMVRDSRHGKADLLNRIDKNIAAAVKQVRDEARDTNSRFYIKANARYEAWRQVSAVILDSVDKQDAIEEIESLSRDPLLITSFPPF